MRAVNHGGWEGAVDSRTSRKTKLIKLLLLSLKEETAQELFLVIL